MRGNLEIHSVVYQKIKDNRVAQSLVALIDIIPSINRNRKRAAIRENTHEHVDIDTFRYAQVSLLEPGTQLFITVDAKTNEMFFFKNEIESGKKVLVLKRPVHEIKNLISGRVPNTMSQFGVHISFLQSGITSDDGWICCRNSDMLSNRIETGDVIVPNSIADTFFSSVEEVIRNSANGDRQVVVFSSNSLNQGSDGIDVVSLKGADYPNNFIEAFWEESLQTEDELTVILPGSQICDSSLRGL